MNETTMLPSVRPNGSWPRIARQVIPHDRIDAARALIDMALEDVHRDYYGRMDFRAFLRSQIYPDARALLIVQHRAIFGGLIPLLLTDQMIELARSQFKRPPGLFNVAFVRAAFPDGGSRGPQRLDNYTYGPLHRDDYEGAPTLTFWVPLNDIDHSTGGLVWTHDETIARTIGDGTSPATYHRRGAVSPQFVQTLKERSVQVVCEKGDVVFFDRTLLHGSNYSLEKPRVTVDLRLVDSASESLQSTGRGIRTRILGLDRLEVAEQQSFIELLRLGDVKFTRQHPDLRRKYWRHVLYPWVSGGLAVASVLYLGSRRRLRMVLRGRAGGGT